MSWKPKWWHVLGVMLIGAAVVGVALTFVQAPRSLDEQHLKTTVALVELHKLRFGRYPNTLDDLKFLGEWDRIAIKSTRYCVNADRSGYYVAVTRAGASSPPAEFWQGTGFRGELVAACH